MSTIYYCGKCQQNHRYTSKIGQKHLKYEEEPPKTETPDQGIKLLDTNETFFQEETLTKHEDSDQISNLPDGLDTNLQEEPADTEETTENIDSDGTTVININEDLVEKAHSNRIVRFIRDYQRSYQKGVERFGIWWKVFQLSIWGIVLIFLAIAGIILIVYLPKIDMINWTLR